jgi:ribosomal protein L16/L10AE
MTKRRRTDVFHRRVIVKRPVSVRVQEGRLRCRLRGNVVGVAMVVRVSVVVRVNVRGTSAGEGGSRDEVGCHFGVRKGAGG